MTEKKYLIPVFILLFLAFLTSVSVSQPLREITDSNHRVVTIPIKIDRIICSGPGCLRLITYFGAQDRVVAVDDIETRTNKFDGKNDLEKINLNLLPKYILENKEKFKEWIEK
ncbi:MAG: hypothetical protein HN597_06470 [Desulfobacula sp.]|uniref:hypothetical protein n=1 Tax=Desulfobacula sp. TaxID=2593537 RepID=UPI0039B935F6|nr:hypothetical protein [Desulfobacula sp.]